MTLPALLDELEMAGIRLEPHGGWLDIDAPQGVVGAELLERLKRHKVELLALLTGPTPADDLPADSQQPHGDAAGDPDAAEEPPLGPDGWPADCVDPRDLTPCATCGRLELWQSLAGCWHCMRCDPPIKGRRLRELAAKLKNQPRRFARNNRKRRSTT